jgi:hypothetical protein
MHSSTTRALHGTTGGRLRGPDGGGAAAPGMDYGAHCIPTHSGTAAGMGLRDMYGRQVQPTEAYIPSGSYMRPSSHTPGAVGGGHSGRAGTSRLPQPVVPDRADRRKKGLVASSSLV